MVCPKAVASDRLKLINTMTPFTAGKGAPVKIAATNPMLLLGTLGIRDKKLTF
jgi:hypothetical protein